MDNTTMPPTNTPMGTPSMMPHEKKNTTLIISLIVVAVVVIAGYFIMQNGYQLPQETAQQTSDIQSAAGASAYTDSQTSVGTTDNVSDIEKDINSTDLNNVDAGVSTQFK